MSIEKFDLKGSKQLDEASTHLLGAAALIRKYGHTKRDIGSIKRGFCAVGAITLHDGFYNGETFPQTSKAKAINKLRAYLGVKSPVDWNNARERTAEEVINALEGAALS